LSLANSLWVSASTRSLSSSALVVLVSCSLVNGQFLAELRLRGFELQQRRRLVAEFEL